MNYSRYTAGKLSRIKAWSDRWPGKAKNAKGAVRTSHDAQTR